jgi:hypothetical protein
MTVRCCCMLEVSAACMYVKGDALSLSFLSTARPYPHPRPRRSSTNTLLHPKTPSHRHGEEKEASGISSRRAPSDEGICR